MLKLPTPLTVAPEELDLTPDKIGGEILRKFDVAKRHRSATVETVWDSVYEMYRASPDDLKASKQRAFREAGSQRDWKHNVNTGKAFEATETLVAYFKGATFPSDDWFDLKGCVPELGDAARIVKALTKQKLEEVVIRDIYEEWVRVLILYGFSTYRIDWRSDLTRTFTIRDGRTISKNAKVEQLDIDVMSPYDVWVDTNTKLNTGGTYVRLNLTRQELQAYVDDEYFTIEDDLLDSYDDEQYGDPNMNHDSNNFTGNRNDIIEYYGPLLVDGVRFWCVHAVFMGKTLIRLADSDYFCGSPYISTVLLPNRDSVYGMSVLHPSLGGLHILNVLTNSRLDNIAVRIDQMWTFVEDGIMKQEDVSTAPGKVFKVASHGSLQPVDLGPPNFTVTYQEEQIQSATIDRNTATGPLIGMGQPRSGERVTAQEINAVRDSGGTRLSSLHSHLEDRGTLPMLQKVFTMLQQYYVTPEIVRLYDPEAKQDAFFQVDPEHLQYPYRFTALGASYVVERQRNVADLLQLLDVSARVPQMSEQLDYSAILRDMLRQMRFNNPDQYLKSASPTPQEQPNVDLSQSLGGDVAAQAAQADVTETGGADMLKSLGIDTSAIDPAQLQQMTQPLLNGATNDQPPSSDIPQ